MEGVSGHHCRKIEIKTSRNHATSHVLNDACNKKYIHFISCISGSSKKLGPKRFRGFNKFQTVKTPRKVKLSSKTQLFLENNWFECTIVGKYYLTFYVHKIAVCTKNLRWQKKRKTLGQNPFTTFDMKEILQTPFVKCKQSRKKKASCFGLWCTIVYSSFHLHRVKR